jgi:hypothetical protein
MKSALCYGRGLVVDSCTLRRSVLHSWCSVDWVVRVVLDFGGLL